MGLHFVFNGPDAGLVWADTALDISAEVIKKLDSAKPPAEAGAPTKPPVSERRLPRVLDRLAHRFPSLLVDAVAEHEPGKRLVAVKNVTVNEDFFQGHFPHKPLMPAVLMIEALTQAATLLILLRLSASGIPRAQRRNCAASTTPSSASTSSPAIN